jgi:hypothetical protein
MLARPRRWEIATSGFDEFLSLVGGDPFGGSQSLGLRVPFLPTPTLVQGGGQLRYLFLLASFSVGEGACVRIRGYRQLSTLGVAQSAGAGTPTRVVEQLITSPVWHPPDGDISWHIHSLGSPNASDIPKFQSTASRSLVPNVDSESYKLYWADSPALLYGPGSGAPPGNIYTNITSYIPPNAGKPYGSALTSKHGTFYGLRTPWETHGAWDSLDIPVRGPDTVAFFASVRQTNPATRTAVTLPGTVYAGGLPPEEQFLLDFPSAQYWRVGGALIVEEE